jgi:hypothetical protein
MALIFPRLARNFVKNGYFPTDAVTLGRVCNALETVDDRPVLMLDPCCGEGAALAELKQHFSDVLTVSARAYGIEYDRERAYHAKTVLDTVAHTDVQDAFVTSRTFGLLFLNPPYGDVVSDKAQIGDTRTLNRLEKVFYQKTVPWLAFGGVMVLIVPHYVIDDEFVTMIGRNFTGVQVYMAPEQQFKQLVIFGVKRRAEGIDGDTAKSLLPIAKGELPGELPEDWMQAPYLVPSASGDSFAFMSNRIDAEQLGSELERLGGATLWPQFTTMFAARPVQHRRPLRDLSNWHLALALAAGQISGVVTGEDGQRWLIKGDTLKDRTQDVKIDESDSGETTTTITMRDRFVPTIVAINFTEGSDLGKLITIR